MNNKLYKLMDWPEIEAVVYSEADRPHDILGAHASGSGTLLQTFQPGATAVVAAIRDAEDPFKLATYKMEMADEEGFFACLVPGRKNDFYTLQVTGADGKEREIHDAYAFAPDFITARDLGRFEAGIHYSIYEKLGAHPRSVRGIEGTNFAVWAPEAVRVSVVGDFNCWDGRSHQMQRRGESGIFEIFIPAVGPGDLYKFELKIHGGFVYVKSDPYAFGQELGPLTASIVRDIHGFVWEDAEWMAIRASRQSEEAPISVYELHLGSFKQKEAAAAEAAGGGDGGQLNNERYLNYRELAAPVIEHVRKMRYTHIELMPLMEHSDDASCGYQVTGFYSPTARYGTADDFMYFINELHRANIGVIIDWVAAYFAAAEFGLAAFDGSCLYEHLDPRQGRHPQRDAFLFNYGRPQVSNFLIANALYWAEKYHVDGLRIGDLAAILYLDYGKGEGEWVANIYGGNESIEGVEFIKHLNSMIKKRNPGFLTIADDASAWPQVTGALKEGGLGFSLKWNGGWLSDYLRYIDFDPYFRAHHHPELTFSMIYAYSERFMVAFSHQEVTDGRTGMIGKMPGHVKEKFANLRLTYAYQMMHPGKKLLFMGQDLAEFRDFDPRRELQWSLLEHEEHQKLNFLVQSLNDFYRSHPALYVLDNEAAGFAWINCISAEKCMLSFMRMSRRAEETLVVVANFANIRQHFVIGVPMEGKFREALNTDDARFGGENRINKRAISTDDKEVDEFPYSFAMNAAPLSLAVFSFEPFTEKEMESRRKKKEGQIKKRLEDEKAAAEKKVMAQIHALEVEIASSKAAAEKKVQEEIAAAEKKAAQELDRLFKQAGGGSSNVEKLKAGRVGNVKRISKS